MSRTPEEQTWIDAVHGWGQRMQEWAHKMTKPPVRGQRQALGADLDQAGQALLEAAAALEKQFPLEVAGSTAPTDGPIVLLWPIEGRTPSAEQISPGGWSDDHLARGGGAALDIAAPEGVCLKAIHDGRVTQAGWLGDCGIAVTMEWDTDGAHSLCRYCHLSHIDIRVGDYVLAGREPIALSGATGKVTGPHLHIFLERDGIRQRLEDVYGIA